MKSITNGFPNGIVYQGDQIGRVFYLWTFFFTDKVRYYIWQNMVWATPWAVFEQKNLVTL
jgi:hypothetical protein